MQMEAYQAAQSLYTYGKHATTSSAVGSATLSLSQLATTSGRTVVPQFDSYVRYFNDDPKYADTIVQSGFSANSLPSASNAQRRELIIATCQYMILQMAALQAMYDAIGSCESSQTTSNSQNLTDTSWDEAAAFLIGSLEGSSVNGSSDGRLIFALANSQCDEFATCSTPGYSSLNDQIISLLYTGRGAYIGASCSALLKAAKELQAILLVPLIQGTLSTSIELHQIGQASSSSLVSDGYVLSSSVLPLVDDADRGAATTISSNLPLSFNTEPVPDGVAAIFAAFAQAYMGIGVDCTLVGVAYNINACTAEYAGSNGGINTGLVVGIPVGIIGFAALVWLLFFAKRKIEKKELPESAPIFVPSNGVFNHGDTELLNGEHYDASPATDDDQENFEDADLIPPQEESDLKIV